MGCDFCEASRITPHFLNLTEKLFRQETVKLRRYHLASVAIWSCCCMAVAMGGIALEEGVEYKFGKRSDEMLWLKNVTAGLMLREILCGLDGRFPANTATASCTLGLWVVLDGKLRADELGDIVDGAAAYERQTDAVHQDAHTRVYFELAVDSSRPVRCAIKGRRFRVSWQRGLMEKNGFVSIRIRKRIEKRAAGYLQVIILDFFGELHLVLIPVASSWFYGYPESQRRIVLALCNILEPGNGAVCGDDGRFPIAIHFGLLGFFWLSKQRCR